MDGARVEILSFISFYLSERSARRSWSKIESSSFKISISENRLFGDLRSSEYLARRLLADDFRDFSRLRPRSHDPCVYVSDAIKAQSSNLPMYRHYSRGHAPMRYFFLAGLLWNCDCAIALSSLFPFHLLARDQFADALFAPLPRPHRKP